MGHPEPAQDGSGLSLALTTAIYECVLEPLKWHDTIKVVAAYCSAEAAIIPMQTGDAAYQISSLDDRKAVEQYYEYWWKLCPLRDMYDKFPLCIPAQSTDGFLSDQEIGRHPYYQEYLRPLGLRRRVYHKIAIDQGRHFLFGLISRIEDARQPPEDRIRFVVPYIEHALSMSSMFSIRSQNVLDSYNPALIAKRPVAILDERCRLVVMNSQFEKVLGNGFVASGGRILPDSTAERGDFERLVHAAGTHTHMPKGWIMRITSPLGGPPLLVRAMPLSEQQLATMAIASRTGVLLAVSHSTVDEKVEPLLMIAGLSRREAQAARLIGSG